MKCGLCGKELNHSIEDAEGASLCVDCWNRISRIKTLRKNDRGSEAELEARELLDEYPDADEEVVKLLNEDSEDQPKVQQVFSPSESEPSSIGRTLKISGIILGIILAVIGTIVAIGSSGVFGTTALSILAAYYAAAFLSGILLYGFGVLIENVQRIREMMEEDRKEK